MATQALWATGAFLAALFAATLAMPFPQARLDTDPTAASTTTSLAVEIVAQSCPPGYDNHRGTDDVCLAFDGTIPGPTFVFRTGEAVALTVHNRVDETVQDLPLDQFHKDRLADAEFSLHRHGVRQPAAMDGVHHESQTDLVDSVIPPGKSFTYEFVAAFPGFWHYHDHALTKDDFGAEGGDRGLYGTMLVIPPGEPEPRVFDLHLLDAGPNGGLGLSGEVAVGERFAIAVAGLGDVWWDLRVTAPAGSLLGTFTVGPGVSEGIVVPAAEPGAYRWEANSLFHGADIFSGEVVAT